MKFHCVSLAADECLEYENVTYELDSLSVIIHELSHYTDDEVGRIGERLERANKTEVRLRSQIADKHMIKPDQILYIGNHRMFYKIGCDEEQSPDSELYDTSEVDLLSNFG